jgi:hypothetical protein
MLPDVYTCYAVSYPSKRVPKLDVTSWAATATNVSPIAGAAPSAVDRHQRDEAA